MDEDPKHPELYPFAAAEKVDELITRFVGENNISKEKMDLFVNSLIELIMEHLDEINPEKQM